MSAVDDATPEIRGKEMLSEGKRDQVSGELLSDEDELRRSVVSAHADRTCIEIDQAGPYGSYRIITRLSDDAEWIVWRRFREFEMLRTQLQGEVPAHIQLPALPSKRLFGSTSTAVLEARLRAFDTFLQDLLRIRECERSLVLRGFLQPPLRRDWPAQIGVLDTSVHDLPHETSATEWWYYNSHLRAEDGREYSLYISFFRIRKHVDKESGRISWAHAVHWAVIDPAEERYITDSLVDPDAPAMMRESLKRRERDGTGVTDPMLLKAIREVLDKGNVPLPDRVMARDPSVSESSLNIDFGTGRIRRTEAGGYEVSARLPDGSTGFSLLFTPGKPAVRHGRNGIVKGHDGDDMFYYFVPRCSVRGELVVDGRNVVIMRGDGWYDHEFGGKPSLDTGEEEEEEEEEGEASGRRQSGESDSSESQQGRSRSPGDKPTDAVDAGVGAGAGAGDGSDEAHGVRDRGDAASARRRGVMEYAWNWVSLQLSSGFEITSAVLHDPRDMHLMERRTLVVGPAGERIPRDEEAVFEPIDDAACRWRSVRTFVEYPIAWRLRIPSMECDLAISASFSDQEFTTFITPPAYWEGRVEVEGTFRGRRVTGRGFVERNGYDPLRTLPDFFRGVGAEVRRQVQAVYPDAPNEGETSDLISSPETPQYLRGVPRDRLAETLLRPVREIADRGGKSWRSYGALACCDVVGGDSRKYPLWLAMPEFMHVGSLIVDDIQDKSLTRRGGKSAHLLFGEPLCINAGTAAYFMCQKLIVNDDFTDAIKCRVYDLYFLALRAGHAGQALDIAGLDYLMDEVVRTGAVAEAEERVLAIHRLKTAAPAGSLARMGAVAGGGTEEQVEAVGNYYESVGVAFQIMDDVLNLRGLYTNKADLKAGQQLKVVGEDIMAGKVTIPVVKAMGVMGPEARRELWDIVRSKPQDHAVVRDCIAKIEEVGALDACVEQASEMVEEAWRVLDAKVPDSFAKIMLRSFGWYVIERHR